MVNKVSSNQKSQTITDTTEQKKTEEKDKTSSSGKLKLNGSSEGANYKQGKVVPNSASESHTRKVTPSENSRGNVTYLSLASQKTSKSTDTSGTPARLKSEDTGKTPVVSLKGAGSDKSSEVWQKTSTDNKTKKLDAKADAASSQNNAVKSYLKANEGTDLKETIQDKSGTVSPKTPSESKEPLDVKATQAAPSENKQKPSENVDTRPVDDKNSLTYQLDDQGHAVSGDTDLSLAQKTDTSNNPYAGLDTDYRRTDTGDQTSDRYAGLSKNDRLVQELLDGNREAADEIGPLPDVSSYQSDVKLDPITEADVAESKHWQEIGIASPTYADDAKTLDDQKFSIVQDAFKDVDRSFVNPNNINELDKLSVEQKSALLTDLVELKQNFNAYDNQYGDFVPNAEEVGGNIDSRINTLMNDPETQAYINDVTAKGLQDYVARPENSDLQQRLRNAYLDDIVGGKAIDRALDSGKSFDDALIDYNNELATLTEVLPSDFTSLKTNVAEATLSQRVQDHFIGDGTPGDLSAIIGDGSGKAPALDKAAEALSLEFMGENANNPEMNQASLKLNYAQDITRDADGVLRQIRNGMKYEDAMASYEKSLGKSTTPLGVDSDAYKAGLIHGVQALTMSGVLVSRSLQPGKQWTPDEIAATVGTGVAIIGTTTEGLAKNLDSAGKRFSIFGTSTGTYGKALASVVDPKTLESSGKIIGAAGGAALAGLSFFNASRSINQGEPIKAALEIIGGTAGLGSATIGFTEAALQLTNAIPRMFGATAGTYMSEVASVASGIAKSALAVGGLVTGVVGGLAGFGLGLYDMAKGAQKLDKMETRLNEKLAKYTGDHVQFTDKPDPDFTW